MHFITDQNMNLNAFQDSLSAKVLECQRAILVFISVTHLSSAYFFFASSMNGILIYSSDCIFCYSSYFR